MIVGSDLHSEHPRRAGLLLWLGWKHRGFRVENQTHAVLGLCLVLALPCLYDQFAFQARMTKYSADLRQWRVIAAQTVRDPSQPLYQRYGGFYIYPPFFLTLVWPLSQLPVWAAALLFETLKWVAIFLSLRTAWRFSSPPGEDVPPVGALGSIVLSWRFIWNDLGQGNVNIFLLLAMLVGSWLLLRGHEYGGGMAVAAAACVKVAPALLLVYFL